MRKRKMGPRVIEYWLWFARFLHANNEIVGRDARIALRRLLNGDTR